MSLQTEFRLRSTCDRVGQVGEMSGLYRFAVESQSWQYLILARLLTYYATSAILEFEKQFLFFKVPIFYIL